MFRIRGVLGCIVLHVLCYAGFSCAAESSQLRYSRWTVSRPVLQAGPKGSFDDCAVKDPSIVYYNGKYHVFYTTKQKISETKFKTSLGYTSAPTLDKLNTAQRYNMKDILGMDLIAPQVFYFEPQKQWYMIAHIKVTSGSDLAPVYTTNPDIENIYGWAKPQFLKTGKIRKEFWIDFWVICDEKNAHLFYSNQKGSVLRMQCPIETFPEDFANASEQEAFTVTGQDEVGVWRAFEAQHIYHVKKTNQYFAESECAYLRPGKNPYPLDSRKRFLIGLIADRLEGPWTRIENREIEYWAQAGNLFNEDGTKSKYSQVSHPELIRSGYNQRLEIDDLNTVLMLFQSFDSSQTPDNYNYDDLPWELAVIKNY